MELPLGRLIPQHHAMGKHACHDRRVEETLVKGGATAASGIPSPPHAIQKNRHHDYNPGHNLLHPIGYSHL